MIISFSYHLKNEDLIGKQEHPISTQNISCFRNIFKTIFRIKAI